jgi:hypothetical protein
MLGRWLTLVLVSFAVFGCKQKPEQCKTWSSESYGASWSDCGDGRTRDISCMPASPRTKQGCQCHVDDKNGSVFENIDLSRLDDAEYVTGVANRECGWNLSR